MCIFLFFWQSLRFFIAYTDVWVFKMPDEVASQIFYTHLLLQKLLTCFSIISCLDVIKVSKFWSIWVIFFLKFVGLTAEPIIDIFFYSKISLAKYMHLKKCLINSGDVALRKIPQVSRCIKVLISANNFFKLFKRMCLLKDGFRYEASLKIFLLGDFNRKFVSSNILFDL